MLPLQESPGTAGTRRLSGLPGARSLPWPWLWLWPGLEEGGTEADVIAASTLFPRGAWSSCCTIRCSRPSTESSPEAVALGLREETPFTVDEVLSEDDRFRAGLLLVLSDSRWEDFSEVGWEPVAVGTALSPEGSGSFL